MVKAFARSDLASRSAARSVCSRTWSRRVSKLRSKFRRCPVSIGCPSVAVTACWRNASIGKTKGILVLATRQRKTRKRPWNIPAPSPGGPSGAIPEIRPERALVVTRTDRHAKRSVVAPLPGAALETPPVGAVRSRGTRCHRLRGSGRRGGLLRKSPHCKWLLVGKSAQKAPGDQGVVGCGAAWGAGVAGRKRLLNVLSVMIWEPRDASIVTHFNWATQ